MDCSKIGNLIFDLRREKGMTQKQVADKLNISDKAVSKWERGIGCPDVCLLTELSELFGVNVQQLLSGSLDQNDVSGGNMKRIKFYVCPTCGNIISATGSGDVSCCGRRLEPLKAVEPNDTHKAVVEQIENDFFITFDHEMTKQHYISFVAYVMMDRVLTIKLYPEQSAQVRFPKMCGGELYYYCVNHGLMKQKIK